MRGLLIVKIRLREVAGPIPDELRFIIILGQYCTGQLYLSAVLYRTWIGLREGRGIKSQRAQIFLLFWNTGIVQYRIVQDSCIRLLSSVKIPRDRILGFQDCGRVAGSIPDELKFIIILG